MKKSMQSRLAILVVVALGGAAIAQAQSRVPRGNQGVRSRGNSGGGAGVTRSSGRSHSGSTSLGSSRSSSGAFRSPGLRGTAQRPPVHRSTGAAGVSRRFWTESPVRPGTPIHRPPNTGQRPPGYHPSSPIHGVPPQWGWRYWTWPYHYNLGPWGWPHYWSSWQPFYWGAWGFSGYWGNAFPVPFPYVAGGAYSSGWGGEQVETAIRGGLELRIKPRNTQVWIDGDYAGLAKDFDGYPSYLWVNGGSYEVSFYLPGYETVTQGFEVRPGHVGRVKMKLRRGPTEALPPSRP